jgi:hypothetical protein
MGKSGQCLIGLIVSATNRRWPGDQAERRGTGQMPATQAGDRRPNLGFRQPHHI